MESPNLEELKKFMQENLVTKQEAAKITGQSITAINQSIKKRMIQPFFESNGQGPAKVRLYLKSDIEWYRDHKKMQ